MLKLFRRKFSNHEGYRKLKSLSVRFLLVSIGTPNKNVIELVHRYLLAKEKKAIAEIEAKELLEAIVLEVGEVNCDIEGHRLTKHKTAVVSYKSIVDDYLPNVNLEPYRSTSHHWRLS